MCMIVAMISEERSCSFQVFLRSGLAVNDYPGSPYPKKHLQGTPTSRMINTSTQLIYCALFSQFLYQINASVCNCVYSTQRCVCVCVVTVFKINE